MRGVLRGAGAGLAATALMSALMLAARRAGRLGRMPPEKITARIFRGLGARRGGARQDTAATALHFAFGAGAGAVYGGALGRGPLPPVLRGMLFGAAVWFVSYRGWVPALEIMPAPGRDRPGRPQIMLLAHLVYGGALGALAARR